MSDSKNRISNLLIVSVVIACVVFLDFRGTLKNGFAEIDDNYFVIDNPMIQSLSPHNLWEMAISFHEGNWQPLTWFSHAIDYRLFQFNPTGHHLTSIILHSLNAVWVFVLFLRLAGKNVPTSQAEPALIAGGMVAALLFGVHPLRVESVVWVSERKDLLCAFFALATYWAYLSYVSATNKKSRQYWYFATLFLMLFALMSKSMAVTVPVVLLLLDAGVLNRMKNFYQSKNLIVEKIPFFALSLTVGTITFVAQRQVGALAPASFDLIFRITNAFRSILFYIEKTLWPAHLIPMYPFPRSAPLLNGWLFMPGVGVIVVSLVCIWIWKKGRPLLPVIWFYYLITLAPVMGIIQVGGQAAADRYTYLPTLSFYILTGLGATWVWRKNYPAVVLLCSILTVSNLGYLTVRQTEVWKSPETFWNYIAVSLPDRLASVDYGLGRVYRQKGMLKEAEASYMAALMSNAHCVEVPFWIDAFNGLGNLYSEKGLYEDAERDYKIALGIDPDNILVHNNLGLLYLKMGRTEIAGAQFMKIIQLNRDNEETHNNLGILYRTLGLLNNAEREFRAAIDINPHYIQGHLNLGSLYLETGQLDQAANEFKWLSYQESEHSEIHNHLGEVYLKKGLKMEAEAEFKKAQELCRRQAGGNPETKCTPYH